MVNERKYTKSSCKKKYLKVGHIARAGYQNSTCEEEHFKILLRGECRCIAPLMSSLYTCAALTTAWKPDPHNLLTVNAVASIGMSVFKPICLAKYAASDEL